MAVPVKINRLIGNNLSRWWDGLYTRKTGIGLDIGSRKIKLVSVKKKNGRPIISRLAAAYTGEGLVENGLIQDPIKLGVKLGRLVEELSLQGSTVVSAAAGQQLYIRKCTLPAMPEKEWREAVRYEAHQFLPMPIDEAAMDVYPLHTHKSLSGKQMEVLMVAVRREQIELMEQVCDIAGLQLAVVDIEPLAAYRIIKRVDSTDSRAIISIGAEQSYFAVFQQGILVYYRSLPLGCSLFFTGINQQEKIETILVDAPLHQNKRYHAFIQALYADIIRSMEYYAMQVGFNDIQHLYLYGGGARLKGVEEVLAASLNMPVQLIDPTAQFVLPDACTDREYIEIKYDFTAALGLAARSIL